MLRKAFKLTIGPLLEPVSITEAKAHLRIDSDAEDALISALIKAARKKCEEFTERSFITQTWDLWMDGFPAKRKQERWWDGTREGAINDLLETKKDLPLFRGPLQSVTTLTTYDTDDSASVFASSKYFVDTISENGRISLNFGESWPISLRSHNAVNVTYVAGYGDTSSFVPEDIRLAIKMFLNFFYENRGCEDQDIPKAIKILLMPYKIMGV